MTDIQAHELAHRAAAARMTIDEMCARSGVQRPVFDAWRRGEEVPASVARSMLRVVENAERGGDRANVPVSRDARVAEVMRCKEVLGWGMPTLSQRLGIPLPQALKINTGKIDVSDDDIDYMQRLVAAIEMVPRARPAPAPGDRTDGGEAMEEDDVVLREKVIAEAVVLYSEVEGDGDDAAGARWAIGQLLARLGMLPEARGRLQQVVRATDGEGNASMPPATDETAGIIGRVPFRATEPPAPV